MGNHPPGSPGVNNHYRTSTEGIVSGSRTIRDPHYVFRGQTNLNCAKGVNTSQLSANRHFFSSENHFITNSLPRKWETKAVSPVSWILVMTPHKIVVCALCLGFLANGGKASGRQKRELRFPKGASVVAAVALASLYPKGPTDGLAHVLEFDLGFPFPEQFSISKKQSSKKTWENPHGIKSKKWQPAKLKPGKRWRTKRHSTDNQRKDLLLKVEDAINRIGFNGFSCVSRFRCELRNISSTSLLEQLLVAIFKPVPEPVEEECEKHRFRCPFSLLQIVMHSQPISSAHAV